MMDHYTMNPWLEEINSGIALIVSILSNFLLIFLTSKVKTYSDSVRWSQYTSCIFRLLFSILVVVTSPTIMYISDVKALYVVKGGLDMDLELGEYFLNLFIVFVITSCTGPTVQYIQVAYLLSNPALKYIGILRISIGLVPILVGVPTSWLIFMGYYPTPYEMEISECLIQEITFHPDRAFLIAPEEKIMMPDTGTYEYDTFARICTFFMFSVLILSVIIVVVCFSHMQKTMAKKKSIASNQTVKSQKQMNLLLLVQFIFPFLTIHIPFYTGFMLPYLDIEFKQLSSQLPFLFAWCPAINPLLVIFMVKNVRDTLLNMRKKKTPINGATFTSSHVLHVRTSISQRN